MSEIEKQVPSGKFEEQKTITSILFSKDYNVNVGEKSFKGCTSLEKINIDNKIKTIGSNAFFNCKKLYGDNDKCDDSSCKGCDKCKVLNLSNCEYIGYGAFANCENLSNVNISNCIEIGDYAFSNCSMLSEITLSENKEFTIGKCAFEKCEKLSDINLSNCKKIYDYAFNGCKSLSQITLDICDELDITAFNDCEKLTKVYIYTNTNNGCKLNNDKDIEYVNYDINYNFYVTYDNIVKYKDEKSIWNHYIKEGKVLVVAGDNNYIYKKTPESGELIINGLSNYKNKFDDDFNFGSLSFNYIIKNVNAIFKGNEELTYIDMPSKSIRIIESAFENCTKLKEIILPNTLKIIEDYAFKNCTSLSEGLIAPVILPESLEELEEGIFAGCINISKFEGKFVTYDGKAIVYNNKLINVALKDINETIKISDIDENIKRLGKYCFSGCENITTVHIPDNILSIGNYAFENCKNLKDIYIYGNPPILGLDVFEKISEDFKIYVDEDKVELYKLVYENDGYAGRIEKREL